MKTGLVLEGGALRTIFSSGVCDALLDGGVMVDYVIGVSAGIAYGVSYISRQPRRNLEILTRFANDRRYMLSLIHILSRRNDQKDRGFSVKAAELSESSKDGLNF